MNPLGITQKQWEELQMKNSEAIREKNSTNYKWITMCRCKAKITQSECDILREFYRDGRTFIFNISTKNGLRVAYVPKNMNPNQIAVDRGFLLMKAK